MALQIAERAVVGEDVEPVAVRSNARPGLWRRLRALADVGAQHRPHDRRPTSAARSPAADRRADRTRVERRGDDLRFRRPDRSRSASLRPAARPAGRRAGTPRRPQSAHVSRRCIRSTVRRGPADRRASRNAGITLRSSVSISSAQCADFLERDARACAAAAPRSAWPVPKRPTFDCVAAGSIPRSVSSAFARIAARCTPSESSGALRIPLREVRCIGVDQPRVRLERRVHRLGRSARASAPSSSAGT